MWGSGNATPWDLADRRPRDQTALLREGIVGMVDVGSSISDSIRHAQNRGRSPRPEVKRQRMAVESRSPIVRIRLMTGGDCAKHIVRSLVATSLFFLIPAAAVSESLFANPFADAAAYRRARGDCPAAYYRLRYERIVEDGDAKPAASEVVIDLAPDWYLTRAGDHMVLRDFRLNRLFILDGDRYTTVNDLAGVVFRVMERQNRTMI